MTNSPASGSQIAIHLSDHALTPLISSSRSPAPTDGKHQAQLRTQAQALTSLTSLAITAYDSASRLDLGLPQRIMLETGSSGPVILHSYLNPQSSPQPQSRHARTALDSGRDIVGIAREDLRPLSGTTGNASTAGQRDEGGEIVNGNTHGGDYGNSSLDTGDDAQAEDDDSLVQLPPLLIASVVAASAGETLEVRRAAARLERMGREFQTEFMREEAEPREILGTGEES